MPLTWDATKIKHFEASPDELWTTYYEGTPEEYSDVNVETKAIIFGSMSIGIGNIKINNAADFYARWKILEHYEKGFYLYSKFVYREDGTCEDELQYVYLSPQHVLKHIGLSTNVGYISKKDWISNFVKRSANDKHMEIKPNIKDVTKLHNGFVTEFEGVF